MAKTIQIDGVGKVQVDDSFFNLTPEQQSAQVDEIAKSLGHTASSVASAAAPVAQAVNKGVTELDPNDVWTALVNKESSNTAGVLGPMTKYGRAEGLAQTLPATAQKMAAKLGLPWQPELLTGTSKQARQYQEMLGKEYFNEGLDKYGGDVMKALRYYNGGPNGINENETLPYAQSIIQAALGHPSPDTPNAPGPNPSPQPQQQSPSDVQTYDAPSLANPVTDGPAIPGFSDQQKTAIMAYLPKAKSGADLTNFVQKLTGSTKTKIGNADQIVQYLRKGGDPTKLAWAAPEAEQSPPQPNPDASAGHVGAVVTRGAGQGVADVVGSAADQGLRAAGIPPWLLNLIKPSDVLQKAVNGLAGSFGAPQTALDKYISAVPEGAVGGAALGPEFGALPMIRAGIGSAVGGQAASDMGLSPTLGSIIGGGITNPMGVLDNAAARVPGTKQAFIKNVVKNPLGPNLVEVARDYKTLADQVHPQGAAPSGRQPLSVEEINAVGDRGLKGLRNMVAKSPIDTPQKQLLGRALDQAVEIPLNRTPDMGPDRIALSDLPNTVEGQAVKAAILRAKAGDMLSARYGGQKIGPIGKAINLAIKASPLPYGKELLMRKGGDINKSRMDAAAKAIKRVPLYEKAGTQLGPSGFGPAMATFYDKVQQTAAETDAARQAKADAIAKAAADRQAVAQSNDLMSRRIERKIVTPTEGYRGLIYQNTGVTQPVQDQALLHMVKGGEITPDDMSRIMSDPNSLMRGKSKAGLKIMDRIGQLADQGLIPRDPAWKGPPAPQQMPQGVLNWLDAQGDPIRSMGAYAGGIVKNVLRDQADSLDNEPPKPAKAKAKSKKKKQGA